MSIVMGFCGSGRPGTAVAEHRALGLTDPTQVPPGGGWQLARAGLVQRAHVLGEFEEMVEFTRCTDPTLDDERVRLA